MSVLYFLSQPDQRSSNLKQQVEICLDDCGVEAKVIAV